MKRHPALAELSRDHHQALVVAKRLRQATPVRTAGPARAFLKYWETEGRKHFRLEEEILLPAYARHGEPTHPAIIRMLGDHIIIRRDAELVASGVSAEDLQRLGKTLASHVRLEEREIFPLIEQTLSSAELEQLGVRLTGAQS